MPATVMDNILTKATNGQVSVDEAQGIVECFVAGIGNKDSVGDIIQPGAFAGSLQRRKPRVVWGHNWNDPIGKILEIYEVGPSDNRLPAKMKEGGVGGLYARVQFNLGSEKGREAFASVAFFGEEQEWSIGYKTINATQDPVRQANLLREVELYECSPVLHGANQLTGTISVKGAGQAVMEHEETHVAAVGGLDFRFDDFDEKDGLLAMMPVETPRDTSSDQMNRKLELELMSRSPQPIKLITAENGIAVFHVERSDNGSAIFRVHYHYNPECGFMLGRPERVMPQMVYAPTNEPPIMRVKPQVNPSSRYSNENDMMPRVMRIVQKLTDDQKSLEPDDLLIEIPLESAFATKSLLDPIIDYHGAVAEVVNEGIFIHSGATPEFITAVETATKGLGRRIGPGRGGGGGLGKVRRAARAVSVFDPKAWDGDGDGIVQEGTPFERPAVPGINTNLPGMPKTRVKPTDYPDDHRKRGDGLGRRAPMYGDDLPESVRPASWGPKNPAAPPGWPKPGEGIFDGRNGDDLVEDGHPIPSIFTPNRIRPYRGRGERAVNDVYRGGLRNRYYLAGKDKGEYPDNSELDDQIFDASFGISGEPKKRSEILKEFDMDEDEFHVRFGRAITRIKEGGRDDAAATKYLKEEAKWHDASPSTESGIGGIIGNPAVVNPLYRDEDGNLITDPADLAPGVDPEPIMPKLDQRTLSWFKGALLMRDRGFDDETIDALLGPLTINGASPNVPEGTPTRALRQVGLSPTVPPMPVMKRDPIPWDEMEREYEIGTDGDLSLLFLLNAWSRQADLTPEEADADDKAASIRALLDDTVLREGEIPKGQSGKPERKPNTSVWGEHREDVPDKDEEVESLRDLVPGELVAPKAAELLPPDDGSFAAELEKKVGLRSSRREMESDKRRELASNSLEENLASLSDALGREQDWEDANPDFDIDNPPDAGPKGYSDELEAWGDKWEERVAIEHEVNDLVEFFEQENEELNEIFAEQREVSKTLTEDRDRLARWIKHGEGDIEKYLLENDRDGYLQHLRDQGWDDATIHEMTGNPEYPDHGDGIFGSAKDSMDDIFEGYKEWERLEGEVGNFREHGHGLDTAKQLIRDARETRRAGMGSRKRESRRDKRKAGAGRNNERQTTAPKIVRAGAGLGHDHEVYPGDGDSHESAAIKRVFYDAANQELQVWFRQASQTTGEGSIAHAYVYGGVSPEMVDDIKNVEQVGTAINKIKKTATYTKKPNGTYDGDPPSMADRIESDKKRLLDGKVLMPWAKEAYETAHDIMTGKKKGSDYTDRLRMLQSLDLLAITLISIDESAAANRLHEARYRVTTGDRDRINPHPSGIMEIKLSEDELVGIRQTIRHLASSNWFSDNDRVKSAMKILDKKVEDAKAGAFRINTAEYKEIMDAFTAMRAMDSAGVHMQLRDFLEFAALSEKGKWASPQIAKGGVRSGRRLNSGAPSDISPRLQGDLMYWGRQQGGFHNVQEIVRRFDRNEGNLSPKDWIRLHNYYANHSAAGKGMRPYGETRKGGLRSGTVGSGDLRHNDKRFTGKAWDEIKPKDWDLYSPEEQQAELQTNLHPTRSGLSEGDHQRLLKEADEAVHRGFMRTDPEYRLEELADRRKLRFEAARKARDAGEPAPPTIAKKKTVAEQSERLKKMTPQERADATRAYRGKQHAVMTKRVNKHRDTAADGVLEGEVGSEHQEFWDSLVDILNQNEDDFTLATLEDAHDRLEDYLEGARTGGDLSKAESRSVAAATSFNAYVGERLDQYETDPDIDRTGSSDIRLRMGGLEEGADEVETGGATAVGARSSKIDRVVRLSDELNTTRSAVRDMERGDIDGSTEDYRDLQVQQQSLLLRLGRATGLYKGGKKNRDIMQQWRQQKYADGAAYKLQVESGKITPLPQPLSDIAISRLTPEQRVARRSQRERAIRDLFSFQQQRDGKTSASLPIEFFERVARPTVEERLEERMTRRMTPEQRIKARMMAGQNRRTAQGRPEREGATQEGLSSRMRNERQGMRSITSGRNWDEEGEEDLPILTRADRIAADAAGAIVGERRPPTESDVPIGIGEDQRLPDKPDINAMSVGKLKEFIANGRQQIIETHGIQDATDPNYPHPALTNRDWFDQTDMVPTSFIDEVVPAGVGNPGDQADDDRLAKRGIETPIVLRLNSETGEYRLEEGPDATLDANGWDSSERYQIARAMGLRAVPTRIVRDGEQGPIDKDGVQIPKTMRPSHSAAGVPTLPPTRELENLKIFIAARQGSSGQARREDIRKGVRSRKGRREKADLRDAFTAERERPDEVVRGLGLNRQKERDDGRANIQKFVKESTQEWDEHTQDLLATYMAQQARPKKQDGLRSERPLLPRSERGAAYDPLKQGLEGVTEGLLDLFDPERKKKKPLPERERPTIPMNKPEGVRTSKRDEVKGRSEVKGKSSLFRIIYNSLDKEITDAEKNKDSDTADALKKLKKSFESDSKRSFRYGVRHPNQTDSGIVDVDDSEVDGLIEALAVVLERQHGSTRGSGSTADRKNALTRYLGSIERSGGITPGVDNDTAVEMSPIRIAAMEQFLEMWLAVGMALMDR